MTKILCLVLIIPFILLFAESNQTDIPKWLKDSNSNNKQKSTKLEKNKKALNDFSISSTIQKKYPELVQLIFQTESMGDNEKQYWFDIMPSMTDHQIDRLFKIFDTERKKLEALEIKYQNEIKNLNQKHLIEWQDFQIKDSKKKIEKFEKEERLQNDDLLEKINEIMEEYGE